MSKSTLNSYVASQSALDSMRTRESHYHFAANNGSVVLPEALTLVCEIDTREMERLFVQASVLTNALDQFQVRAKPGADGTFVTWFSASGDFTSPVDPLIATSGDLTVIAAAGVGWFLLDVRSVAAVSIWAASGNAGGSTISIATGGN